LKVKEKIKSIIPRGAKCPKKQSETSSLLDNITEAEIRKIGTRIKKMLVREQAGPKKGKDDG